MDLLKIGLVTALYHLIKRRIRHDIYRDHLVYLQSLLQFNEISFIIPMSGLELIKSIQAVNAALNSEVVINSL